MAEATETKEFTPEINDIIEKIKGMTILWNLKPDGANEWSGGTILDPNNGKTYKSKLELQPGGKKLDVSGCIAFICRAQTWVRE